MILDLITDRTEADVARYYYFRNKRWIDLTDAEKEEFAKGLKGTYNYTDFRRVENAVLYLSNQLKKYGYMNVVKLSAEETFTPEYIRVKEEIITYLDNIATLQKVYYNNNWVRKLPTIEEWLDYNGANTIEEILVDMEKHIENMKQVFVSSGVSGAGQNRVWQQRFRRPIEVLNYKVYGNAEQATRSGKNLLTKNGLSTPLEDKTFWDTYVSNTTPLEDGWCKVELDNTAGTSEAYANQFTKISSISDIVPGETYSIYFEIRNLSYINGNFYLNLLGNETQTIWAGNIRIDGLYNKNGEYCYTRNTKSDLTGKNLALRSFLAVRAGNKVSFEYRMMIVKGSYTLDTIGDYEPYGVMPSPDYPSEVYGLGSRTRNLLNSDSFNNAQLNGQASYDKKTHTVTFLEGTANTAGIYSFPYNFIAGKKYTFSCYIKGKAGRKPRVGFEDNFATPVLTGEWQRVSTTITATKQKHAIIFYRNNVDSGGMLEGETLQFKDWQLEEQPQATDYIPNKAIELKQKIGDNLLDVSKLENGYVNTYNGYLAASQYTDATDFIKLKANQKYVYTYEYENLAHTNDRGYGIYDLTKNFKWGANYIMTSKKFEITPEEDCYIRISIDKGCTNLMFNEGEALPYVPFIEVNKTIDLTNYEPLMKVGEAEDYIDYENSRIVRNIGKVVYDGSSDEDIQVNEYGTNAYRMTPLHKYNIVSELATNNCMNNQFLVVSYNDRAINKNNILYLAKDYITVRNTNFSTLQEFKTWLSSNPLIVYYQLAEPYYEEIELPLIQKIPGEYSLTAYDEYLDGRVEKE